MSEMGKVGFVWFFGIVEDIDDPLQLGRVRVRIYHHYSLDDTVLPTKKLPWAHVVMPVTSASYQGKGWSPTFMRVDSTVFGFFVDGAQAQMPVVLGTYPGIPQPDPESVDANNLSTDLHDVSKLARGINKMAETKAALADSAEPGSRYNSQYPHNKVFESERGHVVEMDDTPGAERLHFYHNMGSYVEMSPGLRVDKTNGTSFDITAQTKFSKSVADMMFVSDEGYLTLYAKNGINIVTPGTVTMSGQIINMSSTLGTTITAGGVLTASALGAVSISAGALLDIRGAAGVSVTGGASLSITTPGKASIGGLAGLYLNSPIP